MTAGKLISPEKQQQILTYCETGKSTKFIMEKTGMSKSTINDIRRGQIKYKNEYSSPPGRPSKLSALHKRNIRKFIKDNDRETLPSTRSHLNLQVSNATLSRTFKELGLSRRKLKTKPHWTPSHEKKRVDFALARANPKFDWSKWIFSDEKKFNLDGPDGYKYYWHFKGNESKIFSRDSNSRASVMVWGGISKNGITALMEVPKKCNSKKYCDLLEEGLIPYYDDGDIFQQDGASCHTSKETMKFLKENGIETVSWPSKSPDLSPIENVWGWMVKDIYFGKSAYKNVDELKQTVFDSWKRIPDELIDKLIESMPNRMKNVIEMKGKTINY
jgi:transposase